jgi:hypothetical protein
MFGRQFALALTLMLPCCTNPVALSVDGKTEHSVSVHVGDEVRIILGTVGPGEYSSHPDISSSALRFEDVAIIPPFTPGGPTQEFRFKAVAKGQAVIVFTHTFNGSTVNDTVVVR